MHRIYEILRTKTVGIAGCGGLGSNCAAALVRVGIGKLMIADFDIVDKSNLNRQFYFTDQIGKPKVVVLKENLLRINPEVEIVTFDIKLCSSDIVEIFKDCDVIVEAFDLDRMKQMIIETVFDQMPDKFIVSGMGLAGWGDNNSMTTRRFGNLIICGDYRREVSEAFPPLAPRVGVAASMQANAVMELLLGDMDDFDNK